MGKPIIEKSVPHELSEMLCWHCGHRWYAVFPEGTPLKSLQCPGCNQSGGVFKTGQTLDTETAPPEYLI